MGVSNDLTRTTVTSKTHRSAKCGGEFNFWTKPLWKGHQSHKPFYYICDKKKYTVLIFHDSFIAKLFPFLADTFNKTIFVNARPNFAMFKWFIDKYNPDLVIEEMGERGLAGKRLYIRMLESEPSQFDAIENNKIKKQKFLPKSGYLRLQYS